MDARRLEEFRAVCDEYAHSSRGEYVGDPHIQARMHRLEPTARAVLRALDPDLANFNLDTMAGLMNPFMDDPTRLFLIQSIGSVQRVDNGDPNTAFTPARAWNDLVQQQTRRMWNNDHEP